MSVSSEKWFEFRFCSSSPFFVGYILLLKLFLIVVTIFIFLLLYSYDNCQNGPLDGVNNYSNTSVDHFKKRLPQAIIIGVKKGGTRALLEYLRLHPSIKAPGPEVHYFDRYYYFGPEWYRDQMVKTTPEQMTIEKTPSYFITKDAPSRVYSMNPNMKLIIVVRNPVTRAISDYTQNMSKRPGMPSFEEMAFVNGSHGLVNTSWGAIKIGIYHKHIQRWLKYFPRERMHFVDGQRLITHPAIETNLVERFLNLNTFINDKHFYINETKKFPCIIRTSGHGPPRCLGKTKGRQHPHVSEHHLNKLRTFFANHNEKFFRIISQRFDW